MSNTLNSNSQSVDDPIKLTQVETDDLLQRVLEQITLNTFDSNDHSLMKRLVECLGDERGMTRLRCAQMIGEIGKPATPFLLEALAHHPNVVVRRAAAKTLTLIADPTAVPYLLHSLLNDEDTVVKGSSVGALARIGKASVPPLLDILETPDLPEETKGHAAWALAFIGTEAKAYLYQAIAIVDRAASLLESNNPNDIAAALAVLIGRRISEILISQFDPYTDYSILFSQPVKKDALIPPFEIPTLIKADQVLRAIAHLRQTWDIDGLKEIASSERQLKQGINKKYEQVPKAVRRHFSDLIPGREADNDSGEKLYTHVFRSIYAEIATYFYKPRSIPDHRFKAEIQGHFTLTEQGKVRVYTSRPHYSNRI